MKFNYFLFEFYANFSAFTTFIRIFSIQIFLNLPIFNTQTELLKYSIFLITTSYYLEGLIIIVLSITASFQRKYKQYNGSSQNHDKYLFKNN